MLVGEGVATAPGGVLPPSRITCEPPGALSATVSDAWAFPVTAVGENVTLTWQVAAAARVVPQVLVCAFWGAPPPPIPILEIVTVAVPVLASVTDCGELVVPTFCVAKVMFVGVGVSAGHGPCNNTVRSASEFALL